MHSFQIHCSRLTLYSLIKDITQCAHYQCRHSHFDEKRVVNYFGFNQLFSTLENDKCQDLTMVFPSSKSTDDIAQDTNNF